MNHYCSDSSSKWITTAQNRAPNESLLLRLELQMNHYCSDSSSKWITTAQTRAPNESLLLRLELQMNHYCSESSSKWITTAQTRAPNESLLLRLKLQIIQYCADSGSKLCHRHKMTSVILRCVGYTFLRKCKLVFNPFLQSMASPFYLFAPLSTWCPQSQVTFH